MILLSGGIDSPVASFYAMKRGLAPIYAHVHAFQSNEDERLSKIDGLTKSLFEILRQGRGISRSGLSVPVLCDEDSGKVREPAVQALHLQARGQHREERRRLLCIVTGESLGQVASQTASNLNATTQGIDRFIMRPLIGMDKQEIINIARRLGTFELSIGKYKDVCQTNSRKTVLSVRRQGAAQIYRAAKLDTALRRTLKKSKRFTMAGDAAHHLFALLSMP